MPPSAGIRVLFVPYNPQSSTEPNPEDKPEISKQKHAAREYHRKAKLSRRTKALGASASSTSRNPPLSTQHRDAAMNAQPLTQARNLPSRNNPRAIRSSPMDVGVGSLDPFNVCVRGNVPSYVHEMLDHALSFQWPVFSCSLAAGAIGEIKHTVLASTMRSSSAFYAVAFAGAAHNAFAHTGLEITRESKMLRLTYKTRAIEALNKEINSLQGPASDDLLLSMVTLGIHGSGDTLAPRKQATNDSALSTAQHFHFYGYMNWETTHLNAIRVMVEQRGGFQTIQLEFLSNIIALADVIEAFKVLRAPVYPLRVSTPRLMSFWPYSDPLLIRGSFRNLATGFLELPPTLREDPLFDTINTVKEVAVGYDLYLHRDRSAPLLLLIIWGRNCLLHNLLCSPDRSDILFDLEPCLYELCRLGTLAFMLLVLFPLPRVSGIHYTLARRLMLALDNFPIFEPRYPPPDLNLWVTVMGGLLADRDPLRRYFMERATRISEDHGIIDWHSVKDVCATFLWLEADCDAPGELFWEEVAQSFC